MALWGANDSELSKPNWLTEDQKRNCIRTVRGWEIPISGSLPTGATFGSIFGLTNNVGLPSFRDPNYIVGTELLVAMPWDRSYTGATHSNYVARGISGEAYWGLTAGNEPNIAPYFSAPLSGANIPVPGGITSYIPLIVNDSNMTDIPTKLTITMNFGAAGVSAGLLFGSSFTGAVNLPTGWFAQPTNIIKLQASGNYDRLSQAAVRWNPYGGWGGLTYGAAVLRINANCATGNYGMTAQVFDGRGGTSAIYFTVQVTGASSAVAAGY